MNEIFKQRYVVDCSNFEDLILSEMGLPEHGRRWRGDLPEETYKKMEIVGDIVCGWIMEQYGNKTFWECDEDTFYYDENNWYWGEPEDEDYSLKKEIGKQISDIVERLMVDGTIPKEFVMKVWW